jgi:molybdopterin converting factor small subunit
MGTRNGAGSNGIRVEVRLFGQYAEMAGARRTDLALSGGATLGDALRVLQSRFVNTAGCGATGCVANLDGAVIFVNGRNAAHGGGSTYMLSEGDCIVVTTPIGGG